MKHRIAIAGEDGAGRDGRKEDMVPCRGCLPANAVHEQMLRLRKAHPDWTGVRLRARGTIEALKKGN